MKKIALSITLFLITMCTMAQNYQNNITVSGSHSYNITPEYSSKMIVSMNNIYYDAQTLSLSEIKNGYREKLAKAGIASNRITEDNLHYALLGYEKEGTIFVFKTKSLEEMQKFLNVKSIGVTRSDITLEVEITDEQMASYSKSAFDDAQKKANTIATKVGRKIGRAIYISDTNAKKLSESVYYGNAKETRDYYLSVSFELLQ